MQCLVFDDRGEVWDTNSPGLANGLRASISGDALTSYAIKNLGFVAVNVINESVRVRLRPAVVSQVALGGLFYWLHDQPFHRVMLSFLDGEWTHELMRSREEAMGRLLGRVKINLDDRRGDFLHKPRPLHDLPASSPLRAMLYAWSECEGIFDPERLRPLLQQALSGRYILVQSDASSPTLWVKDVGRGFQQHSTYWLSRTKGLRVEDQPDLAYGKWVSELYRRVAVTREPSLEDVDAVISWPHQPRVSYRYRRLVVPFHADRNSTLLLSATVADPDIDLRVKAN